MYFVTNIYVYIMCLLPSSFFRPSLILFYFVFLRQGTLDCLWFKPLECLWF